MKKGKTLERLISSLERALADKEQVKVEAPKRLLDRTTGRLREHDVVLSVSQQHHHFQIALECRDRARPVGVPQVEAFWKKCQDTGIDQGIIVSSNGFWRTARNKGQHLGIRCLDFEEVNSFPWLLALGLHRYTTHIDQMDWTVFPEKYDVVSRLNFEIITDKGEPVPSTILASNAQKKFNELMPQSLEEGGGEVTIQFRGEGLFLRDRKTNKRVPLKSLIAKLKYSVKEDLIPFRLFQYSDKSKAGQIADAAIADLEVGDRKAKLMILYKEDEGGQVVVIPESKEPK